MTRACLLWHTVRHLRPVQVLGRVSRAAWRPRPDLRPPPPRRPLGGEWTCRALYEPRLLGPTTFLLNGREGRLEDVGWDGPPMDRLWRYHQHYFEDLVAEGAEARRQWHTALVRRWVRENPPGAGTGWEPYPTARRMVHLVAWALGGGDLPAEAEASMAVQARWLMRRVEWHLLGNHVWADAVGLIFAGAFFQGQEADLWLGRGLRVLDRQLQEQILADGGHFERSPMYHSLVVADLLGLIGLGMAYPQLTGLGGRMRPWREKAQSMLVWLRGMCHDDGEIGFFNDSAHGMAPSLRALEEWAGLLGLPPVPGPGGPVQQWGETGYIRLESPGAMALLDCAPVGPDYQPGHAHADTLSFELSVAGRRVLVNSGTSTYERGPERTRQRGTAAHNTVVVDGQDSSEVWAAFRVARRARPLGLVVETRGDEVRVACAHDGYCRLPGSPRHRRQWRWGPGRMVVEDEVEGGIHVAEARFHFHPRWGLHHDEGVRHGEARATGSGPIGWDVEIGRARVEKSTYHPRFGVSEPNACLAVELVQGRSRVRFSW